VLYLEKQKGYLWLAMRKKILFFEPNKDLRSSLIEQLLINKNLEIVSVDSLNDVERHTKKSPIDLIIIGTDQEVYKLSSVIKFIEDTNIANKILYTVDAKDAEISAIESSNNKYHFLDKPFRINSFFKKIDLALAKISGSGQLALKIGPFAFYPETKTIKINGQTDIELTEKEVGILKCLLIAGEETIDREDLLKQVWNYSLDATTNTLETHIYRLRQKLEIDPSIPRLIISKDGGFKLSSI
jgi:DNA-binding response OmpR family regulator